MHNDLFSQTKRDNEHNYNDIVVGRDGTRTRALFVSHVGNDKMMFYCNSSLVITDNDKVIVDYLGVSGFLSKHV